MDASSSPRFEPMTTGALLDRAFRLYTGNFSLMLGIAAAAYVPFYLIMLVIESSIGGNLPYRDVGISTLLFQIVFLVLWASIAFPIASGATTYAISERYIGNDVTIGEALRRGLSHFWPLSIAQVTATIRVLFGFMLLIIPGILWMLSYSLIVPVITIEGQRALPSLRRSHELIKNYRGKAFCILLVVNLLQLVLAGGVGLITGLLFGSDSGSGEVLSSAFNNLLSIFLAPLGIVAAILLYYDMRIRKEGFDLEMLSRALTSEPEPMMAASTPSR
ncbi:MAG TPA: hypothetical protein VIE90_02455 [Candidatus Binatia bacterium]|jgi:hypothetical protein